MQMAVVAGHAASQAGSMASRGAYHSTRVSVRAWNNLMQRNARDERSREQVNRRMVYRLEGALAVSSPWALATVLCGRREKHSVVQDP